MSLKLQEMKSSEVSEKDSTPKRIRTSKRKRAMADETRAPFAEDKSSKRKRVAAEERRSLEEPNSSKRKGIVTSEQIASSIAPRKASQEVRAQHRFAHCDDSQNAYAIYLSQNGALDFARQITPTVEQEIFAFEESVSRDGSYLGIKPFQSSRYSPYGCILK